MAGGRHIFAMALLAAGLAGCFPVGNKAGNPAASDPAQPTADAGGGDATPVRPQDPVKTGQQFFQLEMYELAVPAGAISTNADFWKPFDETFLGMWKHDVLYKNGLRVGLAPVNVLPMLAQQLENAETQESSLIGARGRDFEMAMKNNVDKQTIFYFDRNGRMSGKDYAPADNIFAISFRQTPRKSDHVRLAIAPAVREIAERIVRGNAPGAAPKFLRPQTIFELGIEWDLGVDECLVISAADMANEVKVSVGRAFMTEERPAQIVEKALVIIPRIRGEMPEVAPKQEGTR